MMRLRILNFRYDVWYYSQNTANDHLVSVKFATSCLTKGRKCRVQKLKARVGLHQLCPTQMAY